MLFKGDAILYNAAHIPFIYSVWTAFFEGTETEELQGSNLSSFREL